MLQDAASVGRLSPLLRFTSGRVAIPLARDGAGIRVVAPWDRDQATGAAVGEARPNLRPAGTGPSAERRAWAVGN